MNPVAKDISELPDRDTLLSMSGLEFMQALLAGKLHAPPFETTWNFTLTEVGEGKTVFRGAPTFRFANPVGGVHGGWYGAILDSAMGCAVMTKVPKGYWYTTLEYKINLTRAAPMGQMLECVSTVLHSGRSTAVADGVVRGVEDGKVYATGSTTCIIMKG